MRNGSGDEWFLVFADGIGAGLKGLDHESAAYRRHQGTDALVRCVPPVLGPAFSQEAAFTMTHASFVGWYLQSDGTWRAADETAGDDGADWLLTHLLTDAATYAKWASDYYETHVDAGAASRVFGGEPVSAELAGTLGSNEPWSEIRPAVDSVGFPTA